MVAGRRKKVEDPVVESESEVEEASVEETKSSKRSARSSKKSESADDDNKKTSEEKPKKRAAAARAPAVSDDDDDDAPEVVHSSSAAAQQLRELHESRSLPVEKKRKVRKEAKSAAALEALDMDVLEAAAQTDFGAIQAAAAAAAQKKAADQDADADEATLRIYDGPRKKTKVVDNIHITFLPNDSSDMLVYKVPKSASEFLKGTVESGARRIKYSSYRAQKRAAPAKTFGQTKKR